MPKKKIRNQTDQRPFVMVYHDFLASNLLNKEEKLIFIVLKKFADSKNQCFPSLQKISDISGLSKRKVQDVLVSLEKKNVVAIEHRKDDEKGNKSNLYTLYDYAEIWGSNSEDIEVIADEISEMKMVENLKKKGYIVKKEKELGTVPTTAQNQAINSNQDHDTTDTEISQEERFKLEEVKEMYDYNSLKEEYPFYKNELDAVVGILHDTLNTKKRDIRVGGEYKPSTVVIKRLMCITGSEVLYVVEKFKGQTERITNPRAYILTMLYNSKEQMALDVSNQVSHDMATWKN